MIVKTKPHLKKVKGEQNSEVILIIPIEISLSYDALDVSKFTIFLESALLK